MNDAPIYEFDLTTAKSATSNVAVCEATGIAPGTYDITSLGEATLMNVKRNVVIFAPRSSIDMGTLLEGDANKDNMIDLEDYAILSKSWLATQSQPEYDFRADFDHNGFVNAADLSLLTTNWLRTSPVEIIP